MTDLEDIRRDGEEAIIALMQSLDERHQAILRDALRRYGSVENIPLSVWGQIQESTENELAAAALYLMLAGSGFTNDEIAAQGGRVTPTGQGGLSRMGLLAARQAQNAAVNSGDSLMKQIARELENARLDQNLGKVGDLTQEGIDKALQEVFDEARRKRIAVDETTEAITQGQKEAAGGAGATNSLGQRVTVEMRWQTERDNRVCPRCSPLHETPEEVWSKVFPNGPGRDAHPNCRCFLRAVVVVEEPVKESVEQQGVWRTINGNRVFIGGDGTVLKGPKALAGKDLDGDSTRQLKGKAAHKLANDAYEIARKNGDKLPKEIYSHKFTSKAVAMYSLSQDGIAVSTSVNASSLEKFKQMEASGWWSQANPVLHELGHKFHADAAGSRYDNHKNFRFTPAQKTTALSVSKYAATNGLEFVAETYAGHRSGKKYSGEVYRLVEIVTGGAVKL